MNREQTQAVAQVVAGAVLAVVVAAASFWGLSRMSDRAEPSFSSQALAGDVTNLAGLELDLSSSTNEALDVDQTGTGDIAVFRDGGTAVWTLADGGTVTTGGGFDLNGNTLTWDADADTTAVASSDDIITYTLGTATGRLDLLTGNLKVGNGSEDTSLDGEDAYIEGTLEVDGTADLDGTVDAAADVDVGTFLNLSAQSAISLTEGAIITPTGSLQPLTSAAAVTTSTTTPIATSGFEAGDLLVLRNDNASDVITIDGTGGTVECKADIALGTKDTVTLILDTSAWHCLANYDNS